MNRTMLALLLSLPVALSAQGDVTKELERLRGTWVLVAAGGQPLPPGPHAALVITGDKYQGQKSGKVDEAGTIKLNPATRPMSIDLVITEGASANKTQLGIVVVTPDTLTLTLAEPGAARPATALRDNTLVLTKVKPLAKELEGSWEGALETPRGETLRLLVKLTNGADGLATGTLVSVDQGGREAPIAAVVQTGKRLKLLIPVINGAYEGEIKNGQLAGTFTQGAGTLPLVLKRKL
jgi:uncharacterized protein (TIGR03067 family)